MKIKVCGMRDERNIAQVAALEPDYMGFIFHPGSPRFAGGLDPEALSVLGPHIGRVGVFVGAEPEYILAQAQKYALGLLQLHGDEPPELCARLRERAAVIKAFGIGSRGDLEAVQAYEGACDYLLFDTRSAARGGSGRQFDHGLLAAYGGSTPYFLSGGLSPADAVKMAAFGDARCVAADINSRFETAPGVKDAAAVRKFIETIRTTKS